MKTERKSHQRLQLLAIRRLQPGSQLIGMLNPGHAGWSIPTPPEGDQCGRILPPTVSRINRATETNDVWAVEDPMAFAAVCCSQYSSSRDLNITITANTEVELRSYSNMFCGIRQSLQWPHALRSRRPLCIACHTLTEISCHE
jgi:hypothetical protein